MSLFVRSGGEGRGRRDGWRDGIAYGVDGHLPKWIEIFQLLNNWAKANATIIYQLDSTIIKKMPNPVKTIPPINDKAILAILLVG